MSAVARRLLAWYDRHRRSLPWRAKPGERPDPYRIWLSEIMLQQTTVVTVGPYFQSFLARWPNVQALAAAELDEVLHAWQGLGYYARARNLHRCAIFVARELGGRFPDTEAGLAELPGIGPYTAAAIAAIAFDRKATAVDGNIERVVTRLFALKDPLPGSKPEIRRLAATLTPEKRAGDFAQAMMDLGATICVVGRPKCMLCPLARGLPRPGRRHRGRSPGALAQAGPAAAPWHRLLGRPPRRRRAAAPPAGGGAAGRDDGVSLHGLARDGLGR